MKTTVSSLRGAVSSGTVSIHEDQGKEGLVEGSMLRTDAHSRCSPTSILCGRAALYGTTASKMLSRRHCSRLLNVDFHGGEGVSGMGLSRTDRLPGSRSCLL